MVWTFEKIEKSSEEVTKRDSFLQWTRTTFENPFIEKTKNEEMPLNWKRSATYQGLK